MGAEVIKVEIAPEGDRTRSAGLKPLEGKRGAYSRSSIVLKSLAEAPGLCSILILSSLNLYRIAIVKRPTHAPLIC
jgi:hypothetical protein